MDKKKRSLRNHRNEETETGKMFETEDSLLNRKLAMIADAQERAMKIPEDDEESIPTAHKMARLFGLKKCTPPEGPEPWSSLSWDGEISVAFGKTTAGWMRMFRFGVISDLVGAKKWLKGATGQLPICFQRPARRCFYVKSLKYT